MDCEKGDDLNSDEHERLLSLLRDRVPEGQQKKSVTPSQRSRTQCKGDSNLGMERWEDVTGINKTTDAVTLTMIFRLIGGRGQGAGDKV